MYMHTHTHAHTHTHTHTLAEAGEEAREAREARDAIEICVMSSPLHVCIQHTYMRSTEKRAEGLREGEGARESRERVQYL
jgi:hypothetical protein